MLKRYRSAHYLLLCCLAILSLPLLLGSCADQSVTKPWMSPLRNELGRLGARNWVVIAEAAFPIKSRRGLRVIQIDADIPEVLEGVESLIEEKHHLKPRVFVTAELEDVPYDYAPGVRHHKKSFQEALHGRETVSLDNNMLMSLLDDTSKTYRVLVIKTRTALPYSSVFIELHSGYWDADSESALRENIIKRKSSP